MLKLDPLPMEEAQKFWRDKLKLGPKEFSRLSDEAKVKAFAVAGIAKGDELDTVFAALQKAIDQGATLEEFKKDCAGIFERRGWTGKRTWRVDNIFRTNIQTAYNVGQYKQQMETRVALPVWQYSAINDSRTRPTHLAMDGRAWPANHPMWDIWYPPNGYRCRCSVIALTVRQAERRGIKVETVDPTHTLIEPIDPLTGNRMPARQLIPDVGFNINPGKVVYPNAATFKQNEEELLQRLRAWKAPKTANLFQGIKDRDLRKIARDSFTDVDEQAFAIAERYTGFEVKKSRKKGSSYQAGRINMGTKARKSPSDVHRVFRHEYGHYLDDAANVADPLRVGIARKWRSSEDDFVSAFTRDAEDILASRAEIDDLFRPAGLYFNNPSVSDLFGAVTNNVIVGAWGHWGSYYARRGIESRYKQAFANLFDRYAVGGDDWGFIQKQLPNVAAVFERIMQEYAAK